MCVCWIPVNTIAPLKPWAFAACATIIPTLLITIPYQDGLQKRGNENAALVPIGSMTWIMNWTDLSFYSQCLSLSLFPSLSIHLRPDCYISRASTMNNAGFFFFFCSAFCMLSFSLWPLSRALVYFWSLGRGRRSQRWRSWSGWGREGDGV